MHFYLYTPTFMDIFHFSYRYPLLKMLKNKFLVLVTCLHKLRESVYVVLICFQLQKLVANITYHMMH